VATGEQDLSRDFADRDGVALVVGGNGGLGAPIASLLASRGARVALTYRRTPPSGTAAAHRLDLGDLASVPGVVAEVAAQGGGVHTLVHAAGPHVPMLHLSRVDPVAMATQLAADAAAFFAVAHAALPHLRAAAGSIVAVTTAATARFPVRD